MRKFIIGRSREADVVTPAGSTRVSRRHARITELANGDYLIEDLGSTAGTWVASNGQWSAVSQLEVGADVPIRLGDLETTIGALLSG